MKYQALIFDLDGTLLDTLEDIADSVNVVLQMYEYPPKTHAEIRAAVGNGIAKLIERVLPKGRETSHFDRIVAEFKQYYGAHCEDKTAPYEGIPALLANLREAGVKVAIVSNKADFAVKTLAKTYFADTVAVAIGEREAEGIRKKPAPDTVELALKELGVTCTQAAYVGDSEVDVQTAKNCKMPCLSVTWGFRSRETLVASGADTLFNTPQELWDAIQ